MEQFCEHVKSYEAGFAEYALYDESCLYPLPDDVSLERGAMLEPVTIATHAVDQGNIVPGKTVAISRRRYHRPARDADRHAGRRRAGAGLRPHAREA